MGRVAVGGSSDGLRLELFQPRAFFEQLCPLSAGFRCRRRERRLPVLIVVQNIGAQIRRHPGKHVLRKLVEELVLSDVGAEVLAGCRSCAEIEILIGQTEAVALRSHQQRAVVLDSSVEAG
jgi:hypothetical protein